MCFRTCGANKRANLDKEEEFIMYRTLRDMNLSKFVAQDVPLFLSLLSDLFPKTKAPPASSYPSIEKHLADVIRAEGLIHHDNWVSKVIQLYETYLVRHGIMLVGPTGGGKSKILSTLSKVLSKEQGIAYKINRINPKAIRSAELYGEVDEVGEWTTGVFSAMWGKMNRRSNQFSTWIVCDGPVDAIWIEDLNTVLDDNKILTLANGDRIPMTDQNKIMFEVENLRNASPATVSRAGIIYVSEGDLDWHPVLVAWAKTLEDDFSSIITTLAKKWIGECVPGNPGHIFQFIAKGGADKEVISTSRVGKIKAMINLLQSCMKHAQLSETVVEMEEEIERLFGNVSAMVSGRQFAPRGTQKV